MASFYIWLTVLIILILLIVASAVSKFTYDKRRANRSRARTIVSRRVDVETVVGSGQNTVIYTIPASQLGQPTTAGGQQQQSVAAVYPERTMTVTRSSTYVTERDDCPPSYDQVVISSTPHTHPAAPPAATRTAF